MRIVYLRAAHGDELALELHDLAPISRLGQLATVSQLQWLLTIWQQPWTQDGGQVARRPPPHTRQRRTHVCASQLYTQLALHLWGRGVDAVVSICM